MKTLSSVLFVLIAGAIPASADSAYFLQSAARPARTETVSVSSATTVITDRVSVRFRPLPPAATRPSHQQPMVFVDRRYTRGSAQAAIVR